ncbi:MAG: 16S rRNA (cytosine(1402)-N(4))-methyltransferase RsmH [bacterium]|jgi:16S rRNA (cytosine1402-N4)-methyltransferase|nr:16S rRNA (cytosine(1402)-N(4))-methyltransferase RsmH [bacterium]
MSNTEPIRHIPVMLSEVVSYLKPPRHKIVFADCTLGYGGHSQKLTEDFTEQDTLLGFDKDQDALTACQALFANSTFSVRLIHQGFEDLRSFFEENPMDGADYILFDCGFSSPQVDEAHRGFSFMRDGRLDMRLNQQQGITAEEICAAWSETQLADIFKNYGDERFSRRIARAIVRRRQIEPLTSTQELADLVLQAIPVKYQHQEGIHPATRVFQALRIAVNDEIEVLRTGLQAALDYLRPGGRIGILTYHSLEHRVVKQLFSDYCGRCICPPGMPQCGCGAHAKGTMVTRKPIRPCAAEIDRNPRSRSAQFRVLERFMDE